MVKTLLLDNPVDAAGDRPLDRVDVDSDDPAGDLGLRFFAARAQADFDPDIRQPGPDAPNFPNSAFVVPVGVVYLETSPFTYLVSNQPRSDLYTTPMILRMGLWKDFELRIIGNGLSWRQEAVGETTGYSPLMLDVKQHLYEGDEDRGLPAIGFEAFVQTDLLGSTAFRSSRAEPGYSINFDHDLPYDIQFEWNIGNTFTFADDGRRFTQVNFEWCFQHSLMTEKLDGFVHGYVNGPSGFGYRKESMVGWGLVWYPAKRIAIDTSYTIGLTEQSPREIYRVGASFAF